MNNSEEIGVIILAAGSSSRLGKPKQLVNFGGKSLLQHVVDEASSCVFTNRLIVYGSSGEAIISSLDLRDFTPVENPDWSEGIGSSIRIGTARAKEMNPSLKHLMFLLSDQPFLTHSIIRRLIDQHSQKKAGITASVYDSCIGVPVIFSQSYFKDLLALKGDQGAKKIILEAENDLQVIDFPMGGFDIDTPDDLRKIEEIEKIEK